MQSDIWIQPGNSSQFEQLWARTRDTSGDVIIIGALYHPPRPSYEPSELLRHLQDCVNTLKSSQMHL